MHTHQSYQILSHVENTQEPSNCKQEFTFRFNYEIYHINSPDYRIALFR